MKKVLFSAIAAVAVFAMVACNNKKGEEPVDTTAATEECTMQCDKARCNAECCQCGDECKAAQCADCTKCGTPEAEGENAGKCCKAEGAVEGQACTKAEGGKCCKAEGKECGKKCEKAQ